MSIIIALSVFIFSMIFLVTIVPSAQLPTWLLIVPMIAVFAGVIIPSVMQIGDPTRTLRIKNTEKRSKAMMKHGVDNLLEKTKAELLHETKRGNQLYAIRTLIRGRSLRFLKYNDISPTGRVFGCFVPDNMRDADEAMAWKYQVTPYQYSMLNQES